MMKWISRIGIIVIVFFFSSCHTTQKVTTSSTPVDNVNVICHKTLEATPQFSTLNISRMTASLSINGQTWNTYCSLHLLPDSVIVLSIQPLSGFELARIELTPSKVVIINKLTKRYFDSSYDYFITLSRIPISYDLVQNIICRRLFVIGRDLQICNYGDVFLSEKLEDSFSLTSASSDSKIMHQFIINSNYQILQTELTVYLEGSSIIAEYGKTTISNGVEYPETTHLSFSSRQIESDCNFIVHKIAFNKELSYKPTDLTRFERVTFQQLLSK